MTFHRTRGSGRDRSAIDRRQHSKRLGCERRHPWNLGRAKHKKQILDRNEEIGAVAAFELLKALADRRKASPEERQAFIDEVGHA